jgi:hypothetical protein
MPATTEIGMRSFLGSLATIERWNVEDRYWQLEWTDFAAE